MVWVYGGDFKEGSPSTYSGRVIINESVANGQPIVFVAIAYRVGFFGWPFGAEAAANGAGNLGLRDITLALEWVQEKYLSVWRRQFPSDYYGPIGGISLDGAADPK